MFSESAFVFAFTSFAGTVMSRRDERSRSRSPAGLSGGRQGSASPRGNAHGGTGDVAMKFLANVDESGSVIGKGGQNIHAMQDKCNVRVKMSDVKGKRFPGTKLRVGMVVGDNVTQLSSAMEIVVASLFRSLQSLPSFDGTGKITLLVPTSSAGAVIGKQGKHVQDVQTKSGAKIDVEPSRDAAEVGAGERKVDIQGSLENVQRAVDMIIHYLDQSPMRFKYSNATVNYDYSPLPSGGARRWDEGSGGAPRRWDEPGGANQRWGARWDHPDNAQRNPYDRANRPPSAAHRWSDTMEAQGIPRLEPAPQNVKKFAIEAKYAPFLSQFLSSVKVEEANGGGTVTVAISGSLENINACQVVVQMIMGDLKSQEEGHRPHPHHHQPVAQYDTYSHQPPQNPGQYQPQQRWSS